MKGERLVLGGNDLFCDLFGCFVCKWYAMEAGGKREELRRGSGEDARFLKREGWWSRVSTVQGGGQSCRKMEGGQEDPREGSGEDGRVWSTGVSSGRMGGSRLAEK